MNLFLRSSIIIYIAKIWFACLIFRVMANVLSTKFSDWTPLTLYCDYLSHCSEKWFPKSKFSVTLPRVWICIAPLLGLFVSRRSCFAPRRELKNVIWTVLVLSDDAIEHLSPSKPHKALQNRKILL